MFAVAMKSRRSLLVLAAVVSVALAGCSGNSATPTPAPTPTPSPTPSAMDTEAPTPSAVVASCDLAGAGSALAALDSYQFRMILGGSAADTPLQNLSIDAADSYTLTGTIVNGSAPGADIKIGKFHVIETGGYDYFDADGSGTYTQVGQDQGSSGANGDATPTPDTGQSLTAAFSPLTIYQSSVVSSASSGYSLVDTGAKDGVDAIHCTASPASLEAYGSTLGVTDATWTSDVWIATTGAYPVSVALVAKLKDNTIAYEVLIDLSKVNDAANAVEAPTNIGGA
jgi:hypothetical protein